MLKYDYVKIQVFQLNEKILSQSIPFVYLVVLEQCGQSCKSVTENIFMQAILDFMQCNNQWILSTSPKKHISFCTSPTSGTFCLNSVDEISFSMYHEKRYKLKMHRCLTRDKTLKHLLHHHHHHHHQREPYRAQVHTVKTLAHPQSNSVNSKYRGWSRREGRRSCLGMQSRNYCETLWQAGRNLSPVWQNQ